MGLVHYLQHWLSGIGPALHVTDFVPHSDLMRQWADTVPWNALVHAIEQSFATRFPKTSTRGRRPVPIRVLVALEVLKHALGASDDEICRQLRTDCAVMYAAGLREYRINPSQDHLVRPTTLCEFRGRIDEALMDELIAIQAAAAMDEGLVSPAHLIIDTFPCEQGSQRVTDATTLYKAQKNFRDHHPHHRAQPSSQHESPQTRCSPPAPPQQSHAQFWPQVSRPRESLRHTGALHRTTAP